MTLDLTNVLGWGILDIQFLEGIIEKYDIDTDDIKEDVEGYSEVVTDINRWVYSTFRLAADKFLNAVQTYADNNSIEFNKDDIEVKVFVNYLDSFLNGKKLNSDTDIADLSDENLKSYLEWLKKQ